MDRASYSAVLYLTVSAIFYGQLPLCTNPHSFTSLSHPIPRIREEVISAGNFL